MKTTLKELLNFEFTFDEEGKMIALVPLTRVNEIADILTEQKQKIDKAIEYIEQLPFNDLTPIEVKVIYKILGGKE